MAEAAASLRSQAASGARWNGSSLMVVLAVQLAQTALLARLLPASEFGLIGLVLGAAAVAQALSDFGLGTAIIHKQTSDPGVLSSLYWANVLGGAAALALLLALTPAAAAFYGSRDLARLLPLSGVAFFIAPFGQPLQAVLQRDLRFRNLFFCETAGSAAGAAVSVLCALAHMGAFAFVWGQLAAAAVRAAALWIASDWHPSPRLRMDDLRPHLSFGFYQTGERVMNALVQSVDKLLIGRLLGTAALGYYSVAQQLMMRPMLIINPVVTRVAFPVFSRMGGDVGRIREGYLEVVRLIAFVSMPVYLCLYACAPLLLRVLLGPGWDPAVDLFRILVFLGLLFSLGNPLGSLLWALGRARTAFWFNALAFALYSAAIAAGSLRGLGGVAWAQLAACLAVLVPGDLWIRKRAAGMGAGEYLRAFLPFLLMGAATAALVGALRPFAERLGDVPALALLACAGAGAYLAMGRLWTRPFLERALALVTGRA